MTTAQNRHFWAFVVGINSYCSYRNLQGCENDVRALESFLVNQMGVPTEQIYCLIDDAATRSNILQIFQDFLINNPGIGYGDQILFHFSGHGALMRDPINQAASCESLVAYDSGLAGVFNIPDKTMAALLAQLATQKGKNITVILDCCHAGSATRSLQNRNAPRLRFAKDDWRQLPADLDADLLRGFRFVRSSVKGWAMSDLQYTLLAACRNTELAMEYRVRHGLDSVTYGALTYFLLQALQHAWTGLRYDELMERVAAKVNAYNPQQMPQCEGNRGRAIFDGVFIEREPFITVQSVNDQILTLNAGIVHGLHEGVELAIYPSTVRRAVDLPATPLVTAVTKSVTAASAQAEITQSQGIPATVLHGRALVTKHVMESYPLSVDFCADNNGESTAIIQQLRAAIQATGPTGQPSPYLAMAKGIHAATDLMVAIQDGQCYIYGNEGTDPLVEPEIITHKQDVQKIVYSLESIARYRRVANLYNEEVNSRVQGKIALALRKYAAGVAPAAMQTIVAAHGEDLILEYNSKQAHSWYIVDVINNSPLSIYPHLFILQPDYSIYQLYPRYSQEEPLLPYQTLYVGYNTEVERLNVYLPENRPGKKSWLLARDHLKLIVTTEPCHLEMLEQGGLNVPPPSPSKRTGAQRSLLADLINSAICTSNTRFHRPRQTGGTDWGTTALTFCVVHK